MGNEEKDAARRPRLLVVHHTPSPGMDAMLEAVLSGARDEDITGVDVVAKPALGATAFDVLEADAYLLGTPANIGYMSGALKHFFDTVYYPCLHDTGKRPYGLYVHGNEGLDGAVRAVTSIASALGWEPAADTVTVMGQPEKTDLDAGYELGAVLAATIMPEE